MGIIAGITFGIAFSQVQNMLDTFLIHKDQKTFYSSIISFRNWFICEGLTQEDRNKYASLKKDFVARKVIYKHRISLNTGLVSFLFEFVSHLS